MIQFENLEKSFGDRILFSDVNFQINSRERIGLVGRNGHGKSTLLRMVIGEEPVEGGQILMPRNYRIGHLSQHLRFTESTVLAECARGLSADRQGNVWEAEKILTGLGFSEKDFQAPPESFSGGFQVRINLAKVLVSAPDMLLLDEPTNYLDITSIRWMERFLQEWRGEMILVTHDRSFMDRVVTHTVGIHRKKIRKIKGDTEKYYTQIAQEEEIYEKTRLNEEKKRKEVELFISRFRAKARLASMVQSRIKSLEKQGGKEKLEAISELDFAFRSLPFQAKQVLQAENLTFGYEGMPALIEDFSITVRPGERICVVGQNGKGKTTLLKLLARSLFPAPALSSITRSWRWACMSRPISKVLWMTGRCPMRFSMPRRTFRFTWPGASAVP